MHRVVYTFLALCATFAVAAPVQAASFTAVYTFDGSPGNQASEPVDANPVGAVFGPILRGPGLVPETGLNSINSSGWTTAAAPDLLNDFYEFTVTPAPGFLLDLTGLDYSFRRSGAGPLSFDVRHSADGFASALFSFTVGDTTINTRLSSSFVVPALTDLTSPVTFRIYGYGAEDTAGTFRLGLSTAEANPQGLPANLVVRGDLTAAQVPEPATAALLALGAVGTAAARRVRSRR